MLFLLYWWLPAAIVCSVVVAFNRHRVLGSGGFQPPSLVRKWWLSIAIEIDIRPYISQFIGFQPP
ncbi:MAG: hypothetical protein AAF664_12385, partial [Planctomycetota bacterium]